MTHRVLGFHFIFTAYGFWLPNDPRGSWSTVVREWELLRYGRATKTTATHSLAGRRLTAEQRALQLAAKRALRYPPVTFSGPQARAIARGMHEAADEKGYAIHALAVMPDHAHLVLAWHARHIDDIASHLKAKATRRMRAEGMHPLEAYAGADGRAPTPWARNHWCPFLWSDADMRRAIRYVERNPIKDGLRPQRWRVVQPYRAS